MTKARSSKTKVSKDKAAATQRAASKRRRNGPQRPLAFWLIAAGLPAIIVITLIYLLSSRPSSALTPAGAASAPPAATQPAAAPSATPAPLPLGSADYCRKHPRFARTLGFDAQAYLTTSASDIMGLAMIQPAAGDAPARVYQDPTWDDAGWLGHMSFDAQGNVYAFPSPRTSLIDNPPAKQNILYKVDSDSAQMTAFLTLTADLPVAPVNPFGLMGTVYDCDTASLYASTVAGSTASEELGKLVRIDLTTVAVVAELQGIDPFGLAINNEPAGKRLYFGVARTSELYSIGLTASGDFDGQPQLELALPNQALKAWRIVWDTNGDMVVRAMPFDYNLIATSERVEVPFRFHRDQSGLWQLVSE